jgi:amidase
MSHINSSAKVPSKRKHLFPDNAPMISTPLVTAEHASSSAAVSEIVMLGASDLCNAIALREVSCCEVMEAYLEHIGRVNPMVNAIVSLRDRESLIAEACERDDELAHGRYRGWMHGFPQAIKDLAPTKGIRTT